MLYQNYSGQIIHPLENKQIIEVSRIKINVVIGVIYTEMLH